MSSSGTFWHLSLIDLIKLRNFADWLMCGRGVESMIMEREGQGRLPHFCDHSPRSQTGTPLYSKIWLAYRRHSSQIFRERWRMLTNRECQSLKKNGHWLKNITFSHHVFVDDLFFENLKGGQLGVYGHENFLWDTRSPYVVPVRVPNALNGLKYRQSNRVRSRNNTASCKTDRKSVV